MARTARIALDGFGVPESLRWRDGLLWFSDMAQGTVHTWDGESASADTVVEIPGRAGGLGWLPDGRLLAVSMDEHKVYRVEDDGSVVVHADLAGIAGGPVNDMLVDSVGRAYVGNFGFDYHAFNRAHHNSALYAPPGPPASTVACFAPDGALIGCSDPLLFPNGAVITADGTFVVAETLALRLVALRMDPDGTLHDPQPWAPLVSPVLWRLLNHGGLPGRMTRAVSALLDKPAVAKRSSSPIAPDGIALASDGRSIWVANALRGECVRVAQGGRVRERVRTSQHTLSCVVGGPRGRTLFAATVATDDPDAARALHAGRIEVVDL